jgi:hypothetical protein
LSFDTEAVKWMLVLVIVFLAFTASWVLNLIGWKKNKNVPVIIAIVLYVLSLNPLAVLLCVLGLLWDGKDDFDTRAKKTNPLFFIAGIFGILALVIWFVPLMKKADGSSGPLSMFTVLLSAVNDPDQNFIIAVIAISYCITLFGSFIIALPLSFIGRLRNNAKKALITAILYIFSLSIPSAVLCFIGFALHRFKRRSWK